MLVARLSVKSRSRTYGDTTVLDDVSFDVVPGRMTGFVGANGAGKRRPPCASSSAVSRCRRCAPCCRSSGPFWQIVVALAVTAIATVVFIRIGTRLYERTLLQTNKKMGYREAFAMGASS